MLEDQNVFIKDTVYMNKIEKTDDTEIHLTDIKNKFDKVQENINNDNNLNSITNDNCNHVESHHDKKGLSELKMENCLHREIKNDFSVNNGGNPNGYKTEDDDIDENTNTVKGNLTFKIFNGNVNNICFDSVDSDVEDETNIYYGKKNFMPLSFKLDEEHILKFIVVGDYSVGKTAIVQQYINKEFSSKYKVTIGTEFGLKQVRWDDLTIVTVHLWDIAGQERTGTVTRQFYKNSHAVILVCDVSRYKTFLDLPLWVENLKREVLQFDDTPVPIILFANKCDLPYKKVNVELLNNVCYTNNIDAWYLTSAKNNINIEEGMRFVIKRGLEVKKKCDINTVLEPIEEDNIDLRNERFNDTNNRNRRGMSFKKCCRIK